MAYTGSCCIAHATGIPRGLAMVTSILYCNWPMRLCSLDLQYTRALLNAWLLPAAVQVVVTGSYQRIHVGNIIIIVIVLVVLSSTCKEGWIGWMVCMQLYS